MKIFTVIGGLNGVGKSSFTGVLSGERSDLGTIIDTDAITARLGGNKLEGGKEAVRLVKLCLDKGINFTEETTLSGQKILRTIISAKEKDYFVRLYYIGINSLEESLLRINNRVRKGGHDIPKETVERRYSKRFDDVIKVLPYCDEVHFYDNENGFVEVGGYKNGRFFTVSNYLPEWVRELLNTLTFTTSCDML